MSMQKMLRIRSQDRIVSTFHGPKMFRQYLEHAGPPVRANGTHLGTIRPLKLPGAPDQEPMKQGTGMRSRARAFGAS